MELDGLSALIKEAEIFTLENDRMKFQPYFECVEKYCAENDIVIGGKIGVSLLLGEKLSKDSWFWELYCPNTFEIAKKIIELLYEVKSNHIDNRTVTLQTNIKHREFTVMIEARLLFKIYALDKYRDVVLTDVMEPVVCAGWFGSQVKVFPHAMVLIELYQTLYSPAKCKNWENAFAMADTISKQMVRDVSGGFDRNIANDIFLRGLLKDSRIVLIGDYATSLLGIGSRGGSRIQFLTDIPIDELTAMTSRVLSAEKNQLRRVKVMHERTIHVKYNLYIPSDFQIVKHTVYAIVKGEQVALYDVFNSPVYEMIPYTIVDKLQIGAPYVLLRFIFIDIWVLKLINGISRRGVGRREVNGSGVNGSGVNERGVNERSEYDIGTSSIDEHRIDERGEYSVESSSRGNEKISDETEGPIGGASDGGLNSRINSLISLANLVIDYINATLRSNPFKVFTRDYIGVNTSDTVAKKKIIANIGYRLPNLYPVLNVTAE